jgi:hypothetical protein
MCRFRRFTAHIFPITDDDDLLRDFIQEMTATGIEQDSLAHGAVYFSINNFTAYGAVASRAREKEAGVHRFYIVANFFFATSQREKDLRRKKEERNVHREEKRGEERNIL